MGGVKGFKTSFGTRRSIRMGQGFGLLPFAHRYPVLRYKEERDCVGCGWRSPFLFLCSCRGSPFSSEGSEAKILGESGGLFVKNVYFCMPYNELLPLGNNKMHLEGNILRV